MAILKGQALWKPENQDKFLFLYMTHDGEMSGHDICWRKVTMYDTRSIRPFFFNQTFAFVMRDKIRKLGR